MSGDELRKAAETLRMEVGPMSHDTRITLAAWLDEVAERVDPTTRFGRRSHGWTGITFARKVARLINGGAS